MKQCGVCGKAFRADLSGHSSSRPACFCIEQLNAWVEEIEFLGVILEMEHG